MNELQGDLAPSGVSGSGKTRVVARGALVLALAAGAVCFAVGNPIPGSTPSHVADAAQPAATGVSALSPIVSPMSSAHSSRPTTAAQGQPAVPAATHAESQTSSLKVPSAPSSTAAPACPPSRLTIPTLGIDSPVVRIGLEVDGTLGTPGDADKNKAGWYPTVMLGAQRGTVLMDGHTYHDDSALFKNSLPRTAQVGMTMQLSCADGRAFDYKVSELNLDLTPDTYPAFVDARELYSPDGPPQVVIITCAGWDAIHRLWNSRAVLIATPVPS